MAAPTTKPVGYQVAVIVLSLVAVVLSTVVYMEVKNSKVLFTNALKSETDRKKVEENFKKRDDEYLDLRKLAGNLYDEHGLGDDGNTGKVHGACLDDINKLKDKLNITLSEPTYKVAVNTLIQRASDLASERDKQRDDIKKLQDSILALQTQYQKEVDKSNESLTKAERDVGELRREKDESAKSKQKRIEELQQLVNDTQAELDNEKQARATEAKKLNEDIVKLTAINDKLRTEIDKLTQTSFEVADGEIRWVDNQNNLVWINLGEADKLPKRMTFSVYTKSHNGIARHGTEDIKGAIEVTRIVDAHTAEARITKDDLYQPMAKGDPIFTPVWSAGRKDNFSFIGLIDLDGDGKSDRQYIHELIDSAGRAVDNEVGDDGKRIRYTKFPTEWVEHDENTPGIDVNTKFLVICQIPDLALAVKEEDKERIDRMQKNRKKLEEEARQQGVRLVNLNHFLAWIG